MLIDDRGKHRPFHWGQFPLESLRRDRSVREREAARPALAAAPAPADPQGELAAVARHYAEVFAQFRDGEVAPAQAPVPDDLQVRSADVKGGIYFLDAAHVGICEIPANAFIGGAADAEHSHAVVIVVEHGRIPEPDNLAHEWIADAAGEVARMRAAEIAVIAAGYIRQLGFAARAHVHGHADVELDRLAVLAGVAARRGDRIASPYLGERIALAVVTSAYPLATDEPLAPVADAGRGWRYWWGINGAESGRERARRARRASHMSRYPMEQCRRVERPTTLILDDEVPRVPRRAGFFDRALKGDLGEKTQKERWRFAYKHPFTVGMMPPMQAMTPLQTGEVAAADTARYTDPAANARALKSLAYHLGADLAGICEIPRYAWFSHKSDGTPIEPYHRYAVVMLIDQGYETMEGASGDDWISGGQSMRAYLRGAEIAGVMADLLRRKGFAARSQTNVDSDVLHIPLILWAGLGELSRIGELVLNPFVGPRFKSVVLTTDMPLEVDKPIDFGLQYFCSNCWKCARECPCDAIPFGDKVMFNGYEIWKPDVERCARYRLTNWKGAACGRCMKTCPLNKVVTRDGPLVHQIGSWLGVNAMWIKPLLVPIAVYLDDRLGYGRRNLTKKWWLDLEVVDGVCVEAPGANQRELDIHRKINTDKAKIAYYHADMMPPPDAAEPFPVDRKAAKAAAAKLETPAQARARHAAGGPRPLHYVPYHELRLGAEAKQRAGGGT